MYSSGDPKIESIELKAMECSDFEQEPLDNDVTLKM